MSCSSGKKRQILAKTSRRCWFCGVREDEMTLDHMNPRSLGGHNGRRNLFAACQPCNGDKAAMTKEEFRLWLKQRTGINQLLFFGEVVKINRQNDGRIYKGRDSWRVCKEWTR